MIDNLDIYNSDAITCARSTGGRIVGGKLKLKVYFERKCSKMVFKQSGILTSRIIFFSGGGALNPRDVMVVSTGEMVWRAKYNLKA